VLTVQNVAGLAINNYLVVGIEGSEQAEMCKITAVTNETVTVDTLKLPHYADEPVTQYRYNARKFYGSTTAGGSYVELTGYGSPVLLSITDPQNTLLEYTGGEGYLYFKSTYWNTTSSEETNLVDATETLANESLRYCSLYQIRRQSGMLDNPFITEDILENYRRRAESEIDSTLSGHYVLPLTNASGNTEVPYIIENACMLLAAGYMDYREYGKDGEGVKWLGEARGLLKRLQASGGQTLIGIDKQPMQTLTLASGVQSYPNAVDNEDGPIQMFTTRQQF
jgi:hypothetical protein